MHGCTTRAPSASKALPGRSCRSSSCEVEQVEHSRQPPWLAVHYQRLTGLLGAAGGSDRLFWELFGGEGGTAEDTFWLDR